jgi:hypothetical protein
MSYVFMYHSLSPFIKPNLRVWRRWSLSANQDCSTGNIPDSHFPDIMTVIANNKNIREKQERKAKYGPYRQLPDAETLTRDRRQRPLPCLAIGRVTPTKALHSVAIYEDDILHFFPKISEHSWVVWTGGTPDQISMSERMKNVPRPWYVN